MIPLKKLISDAYPEYPDFASIPDVAVRGIECDSRKVAPGFLFIAIRGTQKDGNAYIEEALRRGASAVVVETNNGRAGNIPRVVLPDTRLAAARLASAFYGHPSRKLKVVGITGTNGKTTTSYLIEFLLSKQNKKTGVIGTISSRCGGREIPASETTPGPLELQMMLGEMAAASCEAVVMEVSSHALDQDRAGGVQFEGALFTNLTQDHLDYHKSMKAYFECKAKLFLGLAPGKFSVLNTDDRWGRKLSAMLLSKKITFGIKNAADSKAENLKLDIQRSRFDLARGGEKIPVEIPLIGAHNVYNGLGALAAVQALGLDGARAVRDLKDFPGVPGRLERVECGQNFTVFVDFAHTPDGLENVLRAVSPYKKRKLILVFGCGGDRDRTKRPKMAATAAASADFVYVTSDNPRSEDPRSIMGEVVKGFPESFRNYAVVVDRGKAIRQALLGARRDDIVLLAGKGHERTQVVGSRSLPFSDREEAEKVLRGH